MRARRRGRRCWSEPKSRDEGAAVEGGAAEEGQVAALTGRTARRAINVEQPADFDAHRPSHIPKMPVHWFHMLMALADGDLHGLGVMQAVLDQTGGAVRLWPAMLYRNLDKLVVEGYIAERPASPAEAVKAGSPRYFRLTPAGRKACAAEARRLAGVVELARSKRLLGKA